jgi:signal transduction histidine kinase
MLPILVDDDRPGQTPAERYKVATPGHPIHLSLVGSGLGLAIVVDLAALYQGSLSLGSSPTGGLRAELLLPAA